MCSNSAAKLCFRKEKIENEITRPLKRYKRSIKESRGSFQESAAAPAVYSFIFFVFFLHNRSTVLKIDDVLSEIFSEPINIALAATKHFLWHVYDITQLSQSFF